MLSVSVVIKRVKSLPTVSPGGLLFPEFAIAFTNTEKDKDVDVVYLFTYNGLISLDHT